RILPAVRSMAEVAEQVLAEIGRPQFLQKPGRDDLIGVEVRLRDGQRDCVQALEPFHRCTAVSDNCRTSVRRPVTAAAAAIAGLSKCVRAPGPCRPTKLRFVVDAHRWPGLAMSPFVPRHIEQPGCRHWNPASVNTRSSPSASACAFTSPEPGTTHA